ncbi:hypothetical protein ACLKA6_016286 [Drosophila palustris]
MARCMMKQSGASPSFWAEAVNSACYIRNRCSTKALSGDIPYTKWTSKVPTVIHMRVFCTKAYALIKGKSKDKFESRSEECILVGYDSTSKAYRLYSPKRRGIIVSKDVKFLNVPGFEAKIIRNFTMTKKTSK